MLKALMLKSLFEAIMLICFGAAWPLSVYKSWTSRSTGGKSLQFLIVIIVGYVAGIAKCLVSDTHWVIMILYIINLCMVVTDMMLYFRNRMYERARAAKK